MTVPHSRALDAWLTASGRALDGFLAALPPDVTARLDFTPTSLDALEAHLRAGGEAGDGAARYLGETLRRALGGEWRWPASGPHAGQPVLDGFANRLAPLAPRVLVRAAAQPADSPALRPLLRFRQGYGAGPARPESPRRPCRVCNG